MTAARLLEHFDRVAEAPGAVAKLRRFILDLAVRGKLVEQNRTDPPATHLLKGSPGEAARRGRAATPPHEPPFTIPPRWAWASLAELADFSAGRTPPRHDSRFWRDGIHHWVSIADMPNGGLIQSTKELISDQARSSVFGRDPVPAGTILMSFKLTIGKISRLAVPAYHNEAIIAIKPYVSGLDEYLFRILPPFARAGQTKGAIKGATLNRETLGGIVVPIPPLAEQQRIVAKVDALMAVCDRLEAAQAEREVRRDRVVVSVLDRLTESAPHSAHLQSMQSSALTAKVGHVKRLRQTILALAVRGRLVPQDHTDPPVLPTSRAVTVTEPPFEIPGSWAWLPLASLGLMKGGGTPSKARDDFWNGTIPWVSPKDMKRDYIDSAQLSVTPAALADSAASMIPSGSLLFVVRGMILAHSFPAAIARVPLTINQDMKALVLYQPSYAEYLLRALKALTPFMLDRVQRSSHGTCRIEGRDYSEFPIPVPPLAEQCRIVAKVDELLTLCGRLEVQIAAGESVGSRLLDALLHEALALPSPERAHQTLGS